MKLSFFMKFSLASFFIVSMSNNQVKAPPNRDFANEPGDRGSIPGRVIPKTQKMVIEAALLNTLKGTDQE